MEAIHIRNLEELRLKMTKSDHNSGRTDRHTDGWTSRKNRASPTRWRGPNSKLYPQKKHRLGTVSKILLMEGLNWFYGTNLTLTSDVDQDIDVWFA